MGSIVTFSIGRFFRNSTSAWLTVGLQIPFGHRYDGHSFTIYKKDPEDPTRFPAAMIAASPFLKFLTPVIIVIVYFAESGSRRFHECTHFR